MSEPLSGDVTIPDHITNDKDESEMFDQLHAQNMAQLGQTGIIAQNNFVTTTKAQDFDYLEGKRLVSLEEAMGVREVASKSVPAGPNSV